MELSVVILNYNVRYFLELCIKSVQAATLNIPSEIIVVDNQSTDGSCQMVKTLFPKVILIENKKNYGFSKGNNIGVARAKGAYLCILNPDTVVAEDTFTQLLQFAKSKSKLGVVGCKLVSGDGQFLPESKRNIPYVNVALKKMCGNSKLYYANHLAQEEIGQVSILVGAFMFLKREVFNAVKGFDEDYFMYGEDIDLSYKILKAGFNNYYYGKTTIVHFKGESTLYDKFYAQRFFEAMQIFYQKHLKSNLVFDFIVWFGIKVFSFLRREQLATPRTIERYIFVSNTAKHQVLQVLESVLKKPILIQQDNIDVKSTDEIILDADTLSYKTIIETMVNKAKQNTSVTYKILPKQASFVLGSNGQSVKGEVIAFM